MYVCSRELVPFDSKLIQGVCSFICTRESVPFILCSASLSCLCFGQRTLFPFSLYCWTPAPFWSIIFLHLIKKKKSRLGTPPCFVFGWLCPFIYGCWNPVTWAPRHVYLLYDFCCVNAWFMHPGFTWNTMLMGPPSSSRGSWSLALSSGVLYNVWLACLYGLWSPDGFLSYLWHQYIWVPNITDGFCFSRLFSSFVLAGSLFPLACYVHLYIWLAGFPAIFYL
jgi:hypothetical protein